MYEFRNRYFFDYWIKYVREKYLYVLIGFDGGYGVNWLFCISGKCWNVNFWLNFYMDWGFWWFNCRVKYFYGRNDGS